MRALVLLGFSNVEDRLHDSVPELRFKLEGKLSGPWVRELQQCWKTAASTTQGRRTVVDLADVDFIDAEGQSLLVEIHRGGVRLLGSEPIGELPEEGQYLMQFHLNFGVQGWALVDSSLRPGWVEHRIGRRQPGTGPMPGAGIKIFESPKRSSQAGFDG